MIRLLNRGMVLAGRRLPDGVVTDALVAMVTLRYTQSNSVAFTRDGVVLGVGAGQQNRVDCIRLAGAKARTWWLRRHPYVRDLPAVEAMSRQDRLNWQIRFAEQTMTQPQEDKFLQLFGTKLQSTYRDPLWRPDWTTGLRGLTLASDGFLPFRDNIDVASEFGTQVIIEPGGSIRTAEVTAAAQELGITHITTGLRLFHH